MDSNGHPGKDSGARDRMRWQTVALWGEFLAFGAFVMWLFWG